jgi:Zn-dependent protease with chaperone function
VTRFGSGLARYACAALLLPGLASSAQSQEITNPDLFEKSLQAAEAALNYYGNYESRIEARRVAEIGYRIAGQSSFRKFPFSFYLVDMPIPNAFALPGGQIFITRGMLDLDLDDDMLAGLLGHEIGHVIHEHGVRMQRRATLLNVLSQAVLVGVMISSDSGGTSPGNYPGYPGAGSNQGDRVMGAAAAGLVVSELLLRSYGREFEDEADAEGQRLAAAAGFDPTGTQKLMARMADRIPETQEYGYWRTHPFLEARARAAAIRAEYLKVLEIEPVDEYRRETQRVLLAWREKKPFKPPEPPPAPPRPPTLPLQESPEILDPIKVAALGAWPRGAAAETLRLERLHRRRDRQMARNELSRNLGRLIAAYREEVDEVRELDPETPFVAALEREIGGFEAQIRVLYPKATAVLAAGIYETEFLEVFQGNYPDAQEIPQVALSLGDAYSRLGRPGDAVRQYLKCWRAAPESEMGRRARLGLRNLTPVLDRLAALQELAQIDDDPELLALAQQRLQEVAASYAELSNGAEFVKSYPESPMTPTVNRRLNEIAENLYGEMVLYQSVGDHAKALDRIQRILTQAPLSPAAEKLRQRAVIEV